MKGISYLNALLQGRRKTESLKLSRCDKNGERIRLMPPEVLVAGQQGSGLGEQFVCIHVVVGRFELLSGTRQQRLELDSVLILFIPDTVGRHKDRYTRTASFAAQLRDIFGGYRIHFLVE